MAFGGQSMKALLRLVEAAVNHKRFDKPPLGPIGSLLTLTDESWAVPCMQDLGRKARCQVSCVVFNFDIAPHDLTQKEQAPTEVTTMLDVLQCASLVCAAAGSRRARRRTRCATC